MIQTLTLVQQGHRFLVQDSKLRRLGSLLVPLRRSYVLIMPSILFAGALFCWTFGTDFSLVAGASVLSGISLYLLFDLLARRAPLRVSTLLVITLGLSYGLGSANTWFTLPRGDEALGDFLGISTTSLAYGTASVLASCALLLGLGELFEKPIFGEDFELKLNNRSLVLLTLGAAALAISFLHGSTGFMGETAAQGPDDYGRISVLGSLSAWLSGPLLALSVCVSLNLKNRFGRIYARVLSIALFVMIFPLGRRVLIYAIVLAFIGLRLGRYQILWSPLKKIIVLAVLAGFLYAAILGFFYLRVAGYALVHPTLIQRISAAIKFAEEKSYSDIQEKLSNNVQTRTFILGYLAQLEGYAATMETGHGTDLLGQFQLALPSVLFPSKDVFFQEEGYANTLFGSSYTDEANSILTAGAVDFGTLGVLIYPLFSVVMVRIFFEVIAQSLPVFVSCFIILGSCSTLLEPEVSVTAYFLILRNGLLFGFFVWFVMALPEFKIKNVGL